MGTTCEDTCKYADECQNAGKYNWYDLNKCKRYRGTKSERKDRLDRRREKNRDDDDMV